MAAAELTPFKIGISEAVNTALAFWMAEAGGFYAAQGLKVTIESSKGSADVIQNVASGGAAFGFADASAVVLSRTRDLPVTLVAMVHYKTLMSIITRATSGISRPADLVDEWEQCAVLVI